MQAPLDTAALLFRAQAYDANNTVIPNEGTRTEPLKLGPTLATNTEDPVFVADAVNGDHWRWVPGNNCHAVCECPASVLNGTVSFAVRYRPEQLWADRLILSIVDPTTPNPTKHFMLHQTSGNKYMARFWEKPPGWAQIGVTSTTSASTSRTDNIVVTWNATTKQIKLYINGVLEGTNGTGNARSDAVISPLQVPYPYTTLAPAYWIQSLGAWDADIGQQGATDLESSTDWTSGGGEPPPPPPVGELRVFINGQEQEGATVAIDGVPVEPPTGEADKIVEVETL